MESKSRFGMEACVTFVLDDVEPKSPFESESWKLQQARSRWLFFKEEKVFGFNLQEFDAFEDGGTLNNLHAL